MRRCRRQDSSRRDSACPTLHDQPQAHDASGLNLGLSLARGDVIVKVDGHTRVDPDFISASVRALHESGADAVGGPIQTRGQGPSAARSPWRCRRLSASATPPSATRRREQWTDTVPFGGLPARGVRAHRRLRRGHRPRRGRRVQLPPARQRRPHPPDARIRSVYFSRSTYTGLARQYWGYGLAKARCCCAIPAAAAAPPRAVGLRADAGRWRASEPLRPAASAGLLRSRPAPTPSPTRWRRCASPRAGH